MKTYKANTVTDGFIFLEAPKWHDGKIWMSDVMDKAVYCVAEDGTTEKICDVPGMPAGIGFLSDGSLIIASLTDRKLLKWKDGALSDFRDLSALPGPPNDFAIDAQDRIYLGNFGCDFHGGEALRPTALVRLDPDGSITEIAQDMEFPNGAVIIDNGKTLVVNETWLGASQPSIWQRTAPCRTAAFMPILAITSPMACALTRMARSGSEATTPAISCACSLTAKSPTASTSTAAACLA